MAPCKTISYVGICLSPSILKSLAYEDSFRVQRRWSAGAVGLHAVFKEVMSIGVQSNTSCAGKTVNGKFLNS